MLQMLELRHTKVSSLAWCCNVIIHLMHDVSME